MYLGIRTDSPSAEFYLYDSEHQLSHEIWQADRQLAKHLLGRLETFLTQQNKTFMDLTGLFVYQGPGSFTGLRIGLTVMNTAAYALKLPIIGAEGDAWIETSLTRLLSEENDEMVMPHYGADPRITKPRK